MGSPVSDRPGKLQWSNCSIEVVQKWRSTYFCLQEKIKPPKPSCRNGVLEEGEQCECVSEVCQKCCNDKCQLTDGSECSSGICCDKATCKPRTKNEKYRCRKAKDSCDIPELCSGKTNKCPSNYVVADGYECGHSPGQAYCFNGLCWSREDVCSWVLLDGKKVPVFACEREDIWCGKVLCKKRVPISYKFLNQYKDNKVGKFYPGFTPRCEPNGDYSPYQAWGGKSRFWCSTPDGKEIPKTIGFQKEDCDEYLFANKKPKLI
ncbi:coagulation factor X-activating enzyme heavy chain-like [Brevipalpus obovatus]|uniref:coagulation factor X-activating enzyme heavy chain-like n=1 Tax=Brevipalpus obovatus TaxID=246614 RepID=UPI003D9EC99A